MRKTEVKQQKLVYGLDIGTRSIVGTVGYLEKDRFVVVAQRVKEHETRAMIDGQIHDIGAVGETIAEVTEALEQDIKEELKQVCIAAAGRVLRTVTTHAEIDFEGEKLITKEDIFTLNSYGVEKAYAQFQDEQHPDMKFYCVGYTVMKYYMNDYPMSNLENHKAKVIAADLIATFLPDDVVDGLYKAVELAGLEVANLTLEPIAAIEVAIPQMYRMLNIALIDVGAGTSDISITKDGSIVAYGMLPIAGDSMTEDIARHCLVDFQTAEEIKRGIEKSDSVEYKDIMGLPQTISKESVLEIVNGHLTQMAENAADKIMELNGDKPVSAVFVVGGGGKIEGYTDLVAERLGIAKERCALRGEEVMQKIDFMQRDIVKDSTLVTPVGICLNFYEQSNNFLFVTFNGQRIKLYDNNKLAIVDAAMQAEFTNEDLFPKRGDGLTFMFNGKERTIRGSRGESAEIFLNSKPADINAPIRSNDVIVVNPSTKGEPAHMELGKFPEYKETLSVIVNGMKVTLPKFASVNGELQSEFYEIQQGDEIEMLTYYTVKQITEVMDVVLDDSVDFMVNHEPAAWDSKVYDNFTLEWKLKSEDRKNAEEISEKETGDDIETASEYAAAAEETEAGDTAEPVKETEKVAAANNTEKSTSSKLDDLIQRGRQSAQEIADSPVTAKVEEAQKQAMAYAAAQRISAFATQFNQTGKMPEPVENAPARPKTPSIRDIQKNLQDNLNAQLKKQTEKAMQPVVNNEEIPEVNETAKTEENTLQPTTLTAEVNTADTKPTEDKSAQEKPAETMGLSPDAIIVTVNGDQVILDGKPDYIYVDVFDKIDFDLSKPQGKMVETLINGRKAQYIEPLKTGDVLEIFWRE